MAFASYAEFWPFYLRQHADARTRRLHAIGTLAGVILLAAAIVTLTWWLLPLALVVGYGFAWASHLFVEHNKPATFGHPLWSFASDFRMAWLLLTGRLEPELRKAQIPPRP